MRMQFTIISFTIQSYFKFFFVGYLESVSALDFNVVLLECCFPFLRLCSKRTKLPTQKWRIGMLLQM